MRGFFETTKPLPPTSGVCALYLQIEVACEQEPGNRDPHFVEGL